jgi:hypothetical protein
MIVLQCQEENGYFLYQRILSLALTTNDEIRFTSFAKRSATMPESPARTLKFTKPGSRPLSACMFNSLPGSCREYRLLRESRGGLAVCSYGRNWRDFTVSSSARSLVEPSGCIDPQK